ncbi:hypothetical protein I3271_05410 [Photobacterium leiognathi]|uniref:hypothetical protein n=1 Tax=Photobacterium leiognathi TaxID=553611 RepID=UPI001EDDEE62|nr:hypothetical protein [Photobacterium leiognathi]MCG3884118.1 hypothetical protein [Photobacterium leiognathi]
MINNSNAQNRSNPNGDMPHSYQAKVVNVDHPNGLFLAQIRLIGLWDSIPDQSLPWAEFLLPLGCKPEQGGHVPVDVDDIVWVDFPRLGDTRYPRITGSCYYAPEGNSQLPSDKTYGKGADGEPPAPALSLKDNVYERYGLQEYKTTDGTWGVVHIGTGTRLEISKGAIVVHAEGDSFRSSTGNTTEKVDSDLTIEVKGNAKVKAANLDFESEGAVNFKAGGAFSVKASNASWSLG